jgi:hypothetical protein
MAVVGGPSSECLVKFLYKDGYRCADALADQCSHLLLQGEDSLFRWLDVQHLSMLAEGLSEERKSVRDMRDQGLLG